MAVNPAPRIRLGSFPTPLERAPELGSLLGIADLWVKRDDLTGYSWGGNKVRTIEFLLGDALRLGADTIIVCGGPTSNFAALMAVASAHHGLGVRHVSYGSQPSRAPAALAVSAQSGAVIEFTGSPERASMDGAARARADRLRVEGRRPYVVPRGGATAVGALGFANAAFELTEQLQPIGLDDVTIVLPVGSGGTIAGLIAGWNSTRQAERQAWLLDVAIIGVSVSRPPADLQGAIRSIAAECSALWARNDLPSAGLHCRWSLVDGRGAGFGVGDESEEGLVNELTRRTRFLADSTYNAKALMWLREASHRLSGPIIYWHTGGALGVIDRFSDRHANHFKPAIKESKP